MLLLVFADIPISFIDNMTMHAETDSVTEQSKGTEVDSITEQPKDIEIGSVKEQPNPEAVKDFDPGPPYEHNVAKDIPVEVGEERIGTSSWIKDIAPASLVDNTCVQQNRVVLKNVDLKSQG